MGANTPAAGGEQQPGVKHKCRPPYHGGRNNMNRNNNNNYISKEKFLEADPNLRGKIFEAKCNRLEQGAIFKTVNGLIKAQVGTEYDPFVLEYLEKDAVTGSPEPAPAYMTKVSDSDPDVTAEVEKMKFKSKIDLRCN